MPLLIISIFYSTKSNDSIYFLRTVQILAFSFLFLLFGFGTNVEFCDVDDVLFDPLGVGLGRNGVVGVVGVPGGVWFGVEGVDVALPGVATDDWLSDRIETGGMTCVITSLPSESFFTNSAKSTICQIKKNMTINVSNV